MKRMLPLATLTAMVTMFGATFAISSATAQTPAAPACGTEVWSQKDMKYVGVPCAAAAPKTADGKAACGTEAWSQKDMKYVGVPCTGATKTAADGKAAACGTEAWSQKDMKYVGVPCPHQ